MNRNVPKYVWAFKTAISLNDFLNKIQFEIIDHVPFVDVRYIGWMILIRFCKILLLLSGQKICQELFHSRLSVFIRALVVSILLPFPDKCNIRLTRILSVILLSVCACLFVCERLCAFVCERMCML
jgi:hypothetical protein